MKQLIHNAFLRDPFVTALLKELIACGYTDVQISRAENLPWWTISKTPCVTFTAPHPLAWCLSELLWQEDLIESGPDKHYPWVLTGWFEPGMTLRFSIESIGLEQLNRLSTDPRTWFDLIRVRKLVRVAAQTALGTAASPTELKVPSLHKAKLPRTLSTSQNKPGTNS